MSNGSPAARAHFARGLAALHSFWYDEATREFDAAMAADPKMRMAYWGAAMSHIQLLWGNDDLDTARKLLASMPDPDGLSDREVAWVSATLNLVGRDDDVHTSRKKFAAAMQDVHAQFPDDESAAFLAIALLSASRPEDPDNEAVRLRAGELAQSVLAHNPTHPGAAHYLIHAYDTPTLAMRALDTARAYARFAPAAFHARHMPAHVFSRLGMWSEAATSCQAAWDVSLAAAKQRGLSHEHYDFHSLNWLIEMNFEQGHRKDADAELALYAQAVRDGLGHAQRGQYALQVLSYLARTGEWSRADELLAPLSAPATDAGGAAHCGGAPDSEPALTEEMSAADVRAHAAAMRHDVKEAKAQLAAMDAVEAKLVASMKKTQPSAVAGIEATYALRRRIVLAHAASDDRALLAALRESVPSADAQETGGETVLSGLLVHEQIAETLGRLGDLSHALEEYKRVLAVHPHRARSLLGAARAAMRAKDPQTARAYYADLAKVWVTADPGTDGLDEARSAQNGSADVLR